MNFKNFLLNERLSLSTAKKYAKNWDKERYSEWFDGKYRIYLPLEAGKDSEMQVKIPVELRNTLSYLGYLVHSYIKGLAIKRDAEKDPRTFKIGSILQSAIKKATDDQAKGEYSRALKAFQSDPNRGGSTKKRALVAISRHPYDIAGMSTDRGWTSCMDLDQGSNKHFCAYDVKEGTLVAYLINSDDKNINHPIGRIAIKPFINSSGEVYLVPEESVYGTDLPGFTETVKKWLDDKQKDIFGIFKRNKKLYRDLGPDNVVRIDPNFLDGLVKEYRDDLTPEKTLKEFPWLVECRFRNLVIGQDLETSRLVVYDGEWLTGDFAGHWKGGTFKGGTFENGFFHIDNYLAIWSAPKSSWKGGRFKNLDKVFETNVAPDEGKHIVAEARPWTNEIDAVAFSMGYDKETLEWFANTPIKMEDRDLAFPKYKLLEYGFLNGLEKFLELKSSFKKFAKDIEDKAFENRFAK